MIKVTEKYYIQVYDNNYTVCEKRISSGEKTKGNEVFGNATYHPTMEMALTNIINRINADKLETEEVISLKEAIEIMKRTQKDFTELVRSIEELKL